MTLATAASRKLLLSATLAFALVQIVRGQKAASPQGPLEMTREDVFAARNWTSDEITVLDFHLGMNRAEAIKNARKRELELFCVRFTSCDVCDNTDTLCDGINLHLGSHDQIDSINVFRPLTDAPEDLRKFSVIQQFKGQTYVLFHSYSNVLRLKLLGPESSRQDDRFMRTTKYFYPLRGIQLYVSLSHNKQVQESDADFSVTFDLPKTPEISPPGH